MFTVGTSLWGSAAPPPAPLTLNFEGIGPYPSVFSAVNQPYNGSGVTFTYATYTAADDDPNAAGNHALVFVTSVTITTTFPISTISFDLWDSVSIVFGATSGPISGTGLGFTSSGLLTPGGPAVFSITITGTTYIDNIVFNA